MTYYPYFGAEFFRDYSYPYQFRNGTYPGPFGIYPYYPMPYYSDFRLNSLAGMAWEPFQKNWSETMSSQRLVQVFLHDVDKRKHPGKYKDLP